MELFCRSLVFLLLWGIAACTQGTGILPARPDTYTVTEHRAPILGGASEAERVALTEANDYCEQQSRKFVPLHMAQQPTVPAGGPGYSVAFRCLDPDDKELKRPTFQADPNIVIEQRSR